MPTKPLFDKNDALLRAFEDGARTAGEVSRAESLAIVQEYLQTLTAGGTFSPDAWEFVLEALGEDSWPKLMAAINAKRAVLDTSKPPIGQDRRKTMLVLEYQAAAVTLTDHIFNALSQYAGRWIDEGLEYLDEINEEAV